MMIKKHAFQGVVLMLLLMIVLLLLIIIIIFGSSHLARWQIARAGRGGGNGTRGRLVTVLGLLFFVQLRFQGFQQLPIVLGGAIVVIFVVIINVKVLKFVQRCLFDGDARRLLLVLSRGLRSFLKELVHASTATARRHRHDITAAAVVGRKRSLFLFAKEGIIVIIMILGCSEINDWDLIFLGAGSGRDDHAD